MKNDDDSPYRSDRRFSARCLRCGGVGTIIREKIDAGYSHDVIEYCDCPAGLKKKAGHDEYLRRRRETEK
jgi:hypothetical protein